MKKRNLVKALVLSAVALCGAAMAQSTLRIGFFPGPYADQFKRECLKMDVNGMGFRGIERVKGVDHTTVITWVKQIGAWLPDADDPDVPPEVGELDEWETFVGAKKTTFG